MLGRDLQGSLGFRVRLWNMQNCTCPISPRLAECSTCWNHRRKGGREGIFRAHLLIEHSDRPRMIAGLPVPLSDC